MTCHANLSSLLGYLLQQLLPQGPVPGLRGLRQGERRLRAQEARRVLASSPSMTSLLVGICRREKALNVWIWLRQNIQCAFFKNPACTYFFLIPLFGPERMAVYFTYKRLRCCDLANTIKPVTRLHLRFCLHVCKLLPLEASCVML